jgi:hypothetical protein
LLGTIRFFKLAGGSFTAIIYKKFQKNKNKKRTIKAKRLYDWIVFTISKLLQKEREVRERRKQEKVTHANVN